MLEKAFCVRILVTESGDVTELSIGSASEGGDADRSLAVKHQGPAAENRLALITSGASLLVVGSLPSNDICDE